MKKLIKTLKDMFHCSRCNIILDGNYGRESGYCSHCKPHK